MDSRRPSLKIWFNHCMDSSIHRAGHNANFFCHKHWLVTCVSHWSPIFTNILFAKDCFVYVINKNIPNSSVTWCFLRRECSTYCRRPFRFGKDRKIPNKAAFQSNFMPTWTWTWSRFSYSFFLSFRKAMLEMHMRQHTGEKPYRLQMLKFLLINMNWVLSSNWLNCLMITLDN